MPRVFELSEATAARRRFPIYLVDATDGLTPETGENGGQPQISKNGGAWGNTTNTLVEVAVGNNGHYYVELTATELNTLGYIAVRYKSANTAEFNMDGQVVAYDPYASTNLGLTALPTANPGDSGGIIPVGTGTGQLSPDGAGNVKLRSADMDDITDRIWDEARSGHVGAGSFGQGVLVEDLNAAAKLSVNAEADTALVDYDPPTKAEMDAGFAALNDLSAAAVNAEVDSALVDIHLDHLFAATYDPAAKPGVVDALLNELVENDGGVSRYTANALEQAPSAGDGSGLTSIPWNPAWDAEVESEATDALNAYDPPTRAEATSDKDAILVRLGTPAGVDMSADIAVIDGVVDAIKAETDNLPSAPQKNVAIDPFMFYMYDSADHASGKTGLTVAVEVSKDGGAFSPATNSPATEVSNGWYKITITSGEMNADVVVLRCDGGATADVQGVTMHTRP